MSCTNPYKGWTIGVNIETGKKKLKITKRDVNYLRRVGDNWVSHTDPLPGYLSGSPVVRTDYDFIPCGTCYSCRLTKARDWTVRCVLESMYHEQSWFITLTYDDNHLPYNYDMLSGEFTGKSSLCKADAQKFVKRLRKNYSYDNHLKYLCCGEYGFVSQRPHMHFLVFGLKLDDLEEYKNTDLGYTLYNSEFVSRCWPYGFAVIAPVTYESCAYVSRYTVKKLGDDSKALYNDYCVEKEFLLCSLKPAIGYQYYVDHAEEIYRYDAIYLPEGKVVKPPKYFDVLYERDNPAAFEDLKLKRKALAEISLDNTLNIVDYGLEDLYRIKDNVLHERTKSLLRKEI